MTTGTIHSKVVGVTANNPDGRSRQNYIRAYCRPGMQLILRREPENRFDPYAIAVYVRARALIIFSAEVQIGYLNAELAPELARYIDKGGTLACCITEVTGGGKGKPTLGVNILLTKA